MYYQPSSALDGSMGRRTSRRHYGYSQLEGTIGRVADTAHTESFITRRSHLNLLWIITNLTYQVKSIQYILYYILFSSKEQLLWFVRLSHAGFKLVYITVNYGESQANSSSRLETRGIQ